MWLYRTLLLLLTPIILLKIRRFKKSYVHYRAKEALGVWPAVEADLWIHCASVGEVLAVRPLVLQWREKYPNHRLLMTTMTPTGAEQVAKAFPFAEHRYLPMDWRFSVKSTLKKITCQHLLIGETELWPNLLQFAKRQGVRIEVVNARLSERSFQRYQKFPLVSRPLFALPDCFLAHAQSDAFRFAPIFNPAPHKMVFRNAAFAAAFDQCFDDLRQSGVIGLINQKYIDKYQNVLRFRYLGR